MQSNHTDTEIAHAIRTLVSALEKRAGGNDEIRAAIRTLALWVAAEFDAPGADSAPAPVGGPAVAQPTVRRAPEALHPAPATLRHPTVIAPAPLVETTLRIGDTTLEGLRVHGTPEQARAAAHAAGRAEPPRDWSVAGRLPTAPDPDVVAKRSRLKADACRWAIERRTRIAAGADFLTQIKPTDASLIEAARALPDCYLWMLDPRGTLPEDEGLAALAGSFDALALAADVARRVAADGAAGARGNGSVAALRRDLYWLVAEAQSAVRAGVLRAGQRIDRDQMDLFIWLRERTSAERIFVERHMKVEDPADPANWRDLSARLAGFERAWEASRLDERALRDLRHKAAYHAHRLREALPHGEPHDRHALLAAIDGLLARGVAPSAREIADLLVPILPSLLTLPDAEASPGARQSIAAADRLARSGALEETDDPSDDDATRERSPEAIAAAQLLRGRTVVFIGGERRREAQERLERELELAELRWNSTGAHQSLSVFEPEIARPEVSVVLLAIRWASHSYGELQEVCNRYGKIFVRLPGGYSTNQVASQVLAQAGERLRAASPSSG